MLRLGTWDGSLETVTEWDRRGLSRANAEQSRFEHRHADERLTLRNSGASVYDPRLLTLSLGGTFGLAQDRLTADAEHSSNDAKLYGYNASAGVLQEQPLSLNVFANRNESTVSRELAGQSRITNENRGGTLFARRLPIPSTLIFRQESDDEESRVANVIARRADRRNIVRYEGQRGWADSEMDITYEFVDDVDRIFPKLGFKSHNGQVNYSLDFGEELDRHWDSRLHVSNRSGLTESTIWTANESLRVEHTDRLKSEYRYFFVRTETRSGDTTLHDTAADLRHRLGESLATTAGLGGSRQTLLSGEKDIGRSQLDFVYTKRLPLDGRLSLPFGGRVQYEDDRFKTTEASVSQESHTAATPVASAIPLANRFVVAASIAVTKTAVGPLPPGCVPPAGPPTPLAGGVDYTVRTAQGVTEIVPIPCAGATPGVNPGDTIAVDYRFSVSPSLTFMTDVVHAGLSIDYRWFRVFANYQRSKQSLIAGRDDAFLNSEQSTGAGAELRYDGNRLHASLSGEARQFSSTRVRYDTLRTGGRANLVILEGLTLNLDADQTTTEFRGQRRQTQSQVARIGLTYILGSGLSVSAIGGVRRLTDTAQPADQTAEARVSLRWHFRKIEVSPSLEYFERQRGETDSTEYRVLIRTIRRF